MSKPENNSDPPIRKSVTLPKSMWDEIANYRFQERITTEAEAVRRLLQAAIKKGTRR